MTNARIDYPDESKSFRIEKKIGEGGCGMVFLAQHVETKKRYIFKILKKEKDDSILLQKQLENLENVRVLCDKYFVCPYGIIKFRSHMVLVMDYLEGYVDLFDYITSSKYKKSFHTVSNIAYNLLRGLRELHKLGVAHRDIKPENIMVNPETFKIRFIDFGLACSGNTGCLSAPLWQGTSNYMAPEIILRPRNSPHRLDLKSAQATDLFSLGLVIAILFHPHNVHPLEVADHKLGIRETGETYKNLFLRCSKHPYLLSQLNDNYIAVPMNSPNLDLLNFFPDKRRIILSQQKSIPSSLRPAQTKNQIQSDYKK